MDSLRARLMSMTEQELAVLRSDALLSSHLQQTQLVIELKLQQQQQHSNASAQPILSNNINYANKTPADRDASALDLRVKPTTVVERPNHLANKRPKGEFDEPNPQEVERRMGLLIRQEANYHRSHSLELGECACILGSEFKDKSAASVLALVDRWRQLPTDQRIAFKWDIGDLPKDIRLGDINRFEILRREASSGRANFGGVSKRKPLGIRGTRQFLLILYCLWGHPGRDDPMQREGYCPHCFAKIMKPNEQSILVRVVNHFNMKHKRGANPRQHSTSPTSTSSSTSSSTSVSLHDDDNDNRTV